MKILVFAYAQMNLGDDLFLNILFNRYPNIDFSIRCDKNYSKAIRSFKNVTIFEEPVLNYVSKHEFDGVIFIAGSVFMEPKNYTEDGIPNFKIQREVALDYKRKNKPFFYISCNFGSYNSKKYYNEAEQYLKICKDVCFRDKYSFNHLKSLTNVRYAPDAALSANYPKFKKIKDTVGISIIEPSIRWYITQDKKEDYYNFLKNNIMYMIDEGKKVYIFSFCEYEKDTVAQKELLDIIPKKYYEKINLPNYNGDLDSYLELYQKMEYMLCGRFHAVILSIIFGHKYFVTSYSDKTTNVMNDFSIKNQLVKYEEIDPNEIVPLSKYKKFNPIRKIWTKQKAKQQFKAFDNWISKMSKK